MYESEKPALETAHLRHPLHNYSFIACLPGWMSYGYGMGRGMNARDADEERRMRFMRCIL